MKLNKQTVFLILLLIMVFAGGIFPFDAQKSTFPLEQIIDCGIVVIFLLYGIKLNIRDLLNDLKNWKLHVIVQTSTFILFPALVVASRFIFVGDDWNLVWLSLFFLACLPSTVSSSVVMVSMAKGNLVSAIFNATLSGLIGIVATPFLLGFYIKSDTNTDSNGLIMDLGLKVLLPLIVGLLLHPFFKKVMDKYKTYIAEFDKLIILLIVYESFSKAFLESVFTTFPWTHFAAIAVGSVVLFFIVFYILKNITTRLKFSYEDRVTAIFCGSKKSLVHGSVFLSLLSLSSDAKILFLLPIMLYHSFQLFFISWLASKWGSHKIKR